MASGSTSDCVKVAIRVRPFVQSELNRGCVQIIQKTLGVPQLTITGESHSKTPDFYTFNNVFMPEENQEEVYVNSVKPIIGKLFEGYNVTILAYGQTGSGKTFTMGTCFEGSWDSPKTGIIPRALLDIFEYIRKLEDDNTVTVTCSFMELYQENLYDLLSGKIKDQSVCEIREDSTKGIIISGLSEQTIKNSTEAAQFLMEGGDNRSVGATAMNDVSSRSHAIFTVNIKVAAADGTTTKAKFHLVDLAGSERSKKTKATGMRFKEGVKINQGLLALGNVISALGGGAGTTGGYISYRDSKLTRLLQDSLGGNSVTLMIACVSPADYNIEETLSTLRYADRAKKIKNKPVKNQDSMEADNHRLRMLVQDLRINILKLMNGDIKIEGAAGNCGEDCKRAKQEKDDENNALRQQLSSLVAIINGLNSHHLLEETFYNELVERFNSLRDLLLKTCPAEFAVPDTNIFVDITAQTQAMEALIVNYKQQQLDASPTEDDYNMNNSRFDDEASNQKMLEFTTTQIEALKQIKTLERDMKIKQDLLDRKFLNAPFLNDEAEKTMLEYQATIKTLEKELEELRGTVNGSAARRDTNATKVNMDRKHRIEKLEKDLDETRKKCLTLEKTKKLAEQDRKRIEDLRKEIQEMKTARVQLIRQQRSDSDRYKKWIATRDKEINTLKEKGKKVQNEMKRMERMHEKQQTVLKRKVEEAKAVNKRLQDAMDRNQKVQAGRNANKTNAAKTTDMVQSYIDHEMSVLMSTIDAKITMQSLMNDRGLLTERLMNLKSTVNKSDSMDEEIRQLEEDLEMRNTQIADFRQKVMQTDLEAKMKSIPEYFSSVGELKTATSYIIRALLDCREDFITVKTKAEDLRMMLEASEERIEQIHKEMQRDKENFAQMKADLERDFETKLSFFCSREVVTADEHKKDATFVSMSKQLCEVSGKNRELEKRLEELEAELANSRQKKAKHRPRNLTYVTGEAVESSSENSSDDSDDYDCDDSFQDPEWRKTPMHKRGRTTRRTASLLKESLTARMDATGILNNISETSDASSSKRSINGQIKCSCKGSCATKQCGCKKLGSFCSDSCRCSIACVNLSPEHSKDSDGAAGGETLKENVDGTPERERTKTDLINVTTPYYPYDSKKRKPLLQI